MGSVKILQADLDGLGLWAATRAAEVLCELTPPVHLPPRS